MCPANPLPAPWKAYESVLPKDTVVCGNNRGPDDHYPETQLFVYYKGKSAPEAFDATKKAFESAGWKLSDIQIIGEGNANSKLYDAKAEKDGTTISIGVNKNDFGIQGSFNLEDKKPATP